MKYKSILTLSLIISCYLTAACQIFNMKAIHISGNLQDIYPVDAYIRYTDKHLLIVEDDDDASYNVKIDTIDNLIFIEPYENFFTVVTDTTKEVYIIVYYQDDIKYEIIYYNE